MTKTPEGLWVVRLGPGDVGLARRTFAMMAEVFAEDDAPGASRLSDAYLSRLLSRADFWALAAVEERTGEPVGGLTAHALPMTREEAQELFLYDLAVREDRQRTGVGRALVGGLRKLAAAEGIGVVFVPADDEDTHALDFYRAMGGEPQPVTIFTFDKRPGQKPSNSGR